jgi:CRP/FNR family transcriptional regulator, anaerobic regulatory protein
MLAEPNHIAETESDGLALWCSPDRRTQSRVATLGASQRLRPGQQLFAEGDRADDIFETVSGTVRLYKLLPDGRRQIIGFLGAGRLLGFAHHDTYAYTAEAVTVVTLHRYARHGFDRLMDQIPGLARRLLSAATDELRAAQNQMLLLGRKTAAEKIASFLLAMEADGGNDEILVPMARGDIADYLGLTIETVCRNLAKLKQDEIIGLPTPNRITILDRERLEDLAAGG